MAKIVGGEADEFFNYSRIVVRVIIAALNVNNMHIINIT